MKSLIFSLVSGLLIAFTNCGIATASPISPEGKHLEMFLDHSGVDKRWLSGVHIDWRSGVPDGKQVISNHIATHCSAFVASSAEKLGVYVLRPPQHPLVLLANAQYDWLASEGAASGWQAVTDAELAQFDANHGMLVLAVHHNHHDDKPGHIAIVRPSEKSDSEIQAEGPQITQAGLSNHLSTTLRDGFAGHPAAWGNHEVRYYAHAIDWSRLPDL